MPGTVTRKLLTHYPQYEETLPESTHITKDYDSTIGTPLPKQETRNAPLLLFKRRAWSMDRAIRKPIYSYFKKILSFNLVKIEILFRNSIKN